MLVIGSGAPRLDPAPAHVVAQRSGHLAQRRPRRKDVRTPSTVGPWAKTTRRGFESREPPLQALRYAVWSRRHRPTGRGAIGVRARSGPARSCPAHDAAEPQSPDPSSTSFGRPTRQVEEADLRCGPDRGRRARRITSPGLHQAYSLGTTTARARWRGYVNHSCSPNCGVRLNDAGAYDFVAREPIAAGEEITFDYAMRNTRSSTSRAAVFVAQIHVVVR